MLEQRIHQQFFDSADLKYAAAEILAKPIADAVSTLVGCITGGGKVLACGNGGSEWLECDTTDLTAHAGVDATVGAPLVRREDRAALLCGDTTTTDEVWTVANAAKDLIEKLVRGEEVRGFRSISGRE